jgi:hypothetical protein
VKRQISASVQNLVASQRLATSMSASIMLIETQPLMELIPSSAVRRPVWPQPPAGRRYRKTDASNNAAACAYQDWGGRWTVAGFGATLRPLQRFTSGRSGRQDQSGFLCKAPYSSAIWNVAAYKPCYVSPAAAWNSEPHHRWSGVRPVWPLAGRRFALLLESRAQ